MQDFWLCREYGLEAYWCGDAAERERTWSSMIHLTIDRAKKSVLASGEDVIEGKGEVLVNGKSIGTKQSWIMRYERPMTAEEHDTLVRLVNECDTCGEKSDVETRTDNPFGTPR